MHIFKVNYTFKATLFDEFFPNGLFLFEYDTRSELEPKPNPIKPIKANGWALAIAGVIISVALTTLVIKGGRWVKVKLDQDRKGEFINKTRDKPKNEDDNSNTHHKRDKYYGKWL